MSIRTTLFSLSNRLSANVLANSVLPTPVGPRKRKDPMGRCGSLMPARARKIASVTASTASFCPITRSCKIFCKRSSLSRSPSISLVTGTPVHLATISAISSAVTSSLRMASSWRSICSRDSSSASSLGSFPCLSSATRFRS